MTDPRPPIGHVLRPPKTAELIARHIRGQIVRGDLAAGNTLPSESDLMVQFGVSRPTLREAFRILETESLILIRRGSRGGAQVTAPNVSVAAGYVGLILQMQGATVTDVYEARMVLEPACAALFARSRRKADMGDLRAAIEALRQVVDGGDLQPARLATLTYRCHEAVVHGARNRTLEVQSGVLRDIAARQVSSYIARREDYRAKAPQRFALLIRSFEKLAGLIEAGDTEGAERHWRIHMNAAASDLLGDPRSVTVVDLFS